MIGHYKLVGHEAVPVTDLIEWAEWFEAATKSGERIVRQETVGIFKVSTVFLGLDHNHLGRGDPILFETMVFDGEHGPGAHVEDMWADRCSTWEQAEAMHRRGVAWAREMIAKVVADRWVKVTPQEKKAEDTPRPSFTCPACGIVSYHPKDAEHRFCARCGVFFD